MNPALKIETNPKCLMDYQPLEDMGVLVTPNINADYWLMRVPLSANQAIVAFPKFGTIGIGFQIEAEDWNTNLPFTVCPKEILKHIAVNKGDASISDSDCLDAIMLLQKALYALYKN